MHAYLLVSIISLIVGIGIGDWLHTSLKPRVRKVKRTLKRKPARRTTRRPTNRKH